MTYTMRMSVLIFDFGTIVSFLILKIYLAVPGPSCGMRNLVP